MAIIFKKEFKNVGAFFDYDRGCYEINDEGWECFLNEIIDSLSPNCYENKKLRLIIEEVI